VSAAPASPCVNVCVIDPASGYCRGCARTIDEIAQWPVLPDERKRRILAALPARRVGRSGAPRKPDA
jgi:uncharacterized protein